MPEGGMSDIERPFRGNNYVLIGLPSCGKSTLGRRAAEELGLDFYDTDKLIMASEDVPQSFFHFSDYVTRKETQLLMDLSDTAERSVIATGGSVLSLTRNIPILKRLGYIIFIDRDPEILLASEKASDISRHFVMINGKERVSMEFMNITSHMDVRYADIADRRVENNGGEDDGLANLVSLIRVLDASASSN
jgi:shikimate kinase